MLPVPRNWSELTPAFMTAALAGRCPGAIVERVDVGPVADGTNRRASVQLSYARGDGPRSVFVKTHARVLHRLALLALGAWAAEARLAGSGARLPIERPLPFGAGVDGRRLATVVVMDDVTTAGGRPNDPVTPLCIAQVEAGLAELGRLHGTYWDRSLPPPLRFLRPWRLGAVWAPVSAASLRRGARRLDRLGHDLPRSLDLARLERQFRRWAALTASGPQTVLHGDPHPGNTYALPGHRTGFYDWQLVRTGNWSHDVAYFLAGSLEPEERRCHERDLLAGYLEALGEAGGRPPTPAEAWDRYRAGAAFGLATWLHTLAFGSFQPVATCLATLSRFSCAYEDLGTGQWSRKR